MKYLLTLLYAVFFVGVVTAGEPTYILSNGVVTLAGEPNEPAVPQIQASTPPVRQTAQKAVTKMVQVCTFDAFGRKTSCRMVPTTELVDVPETEPSVPQRVVPPVTVSVTADVCPCGCGITGCACGRSAGSVSAPVTAVVSTRGDGRWYPGKLLGRVNPNNR